MISSTFGRRAGGGGCENAGGAAATSAAAITRMRANTAWLTLEYWHARSDGARRCAVAGRRVQMAMCLQHPRVYLT